MTRFAPTTALFAGIAALAAGTPSAHAAIILDADADTYVYNDGGASNFGGNSVIQVLNDGGSAQAKGKDRLGVIRFDLSSAPQTYTGATLTLTASAVANGDEFQIWAINDGGADEDFDELSLTFDNFAYATRAAGSQFDGSIDTNGLTLLVDNVTDASDGTADGVFHFSSSTMTDFINADTNDMVTFIVFKLTGDGNPSFSKFHSREAASGGPQLTLIPEPASLALLGIGAGLIASRRRRA